MPTNPGAKTVAQVSWVRIQSVDLPSGIDSATVSFELHRRGKLLGSSFKAAKITKTTPMVMLAEDPWFAWFLCTPGTFMEPLEVVFKWKTEPDGETHEETAKFRSELRDALTGEKTSALEEEIDGLGVIQVMVQSVSSPDVYSRISKDGTRAIHRAIFHGQETIVQGILDAGCDASIKDAHGSPPLMYATQLGHADIFDALMQAGANPLVVGQGGLTALHWAALKGFHEMVRKLLLAGCKGSDEDDSGNTPLHLAAWNGNREVVQELLKPPRQAMDEAADPDSVNRMGSTALHIAAERGHDQVVKLLLRHRASPMVPDENGERPAHRIFANPCLTKGERTVAVLVALSESTPGVQMSWNCQRADGKTPLHLAAFLGSEKGIGGLKQLGAKIDAVDKEKNTPMHCAAMGDQPAAVQMLKAAGADVNARNSAGQTPLDCATKYSRFLAVEALRSAGGKQRQSSNVDLDSQAEPSAEDINQLLVAHGGVPSPDLTTATAEISVAMLLANPVGQHRRRESISRGHMRSYSDVYSISSGGPTPSERQDSTQMGTRQGSGSAAANSTPSKKTSAEAAPSSTNWLAVAVGVVILATVVGMLLR